MISCRNRESAQRDRVMDTFYSVPYPLQVKHAIIVNLPRLMNIPYAAPYPF
jgi:hypothetical protein